MCWSFGCSIWFGRLFISTLKFAETLSQHTYRTPSVVSENDVIVVAAAAFGAAITGTCQNCVKAQADATNNFVSNIESYFYTW